MVSHASNSFHDKLFHQKLRIQGVSNDGFLGDSTKLLLLFNVVYLVKRQQSVCASSYSKLIGPVFFVRFHCWIDDFYA